MNCTLRVRDVTRAQNESSRRISAQGYSPSLSRSQTRAISDGFVCEKMRLVCNLPIQCDNDKYGQLGRMGGSYQYKPQPSPANDPDCPLMASLNNKHPLICKSPGIMCPGIFCQTLFTRDSDGYFDMLNGLDSSSIVTGLGMGQTITANITNYASSNTSLILQLLGSTKASLVNSLSTYQRVTQPSICAVQSKILNFTCAPQVGLMCTQVSVVSGNQVTVQYQCSNRFTNSKGVRA